MRRNVIHKEVRRKFTKMNSIIFIFINILIIKSYINVTSNKFSRFPITIDKNCLNVEVNLKFEVNIFGS